MHNDSKNINEQSIEAQQRLFQIHRSKLQHNLEQEAILGNDTPPKIIDEIRIAREAIQRIKGVLRGWNIEVDDDPNDTPQTPQYQVSQGVAALTSLAQAPRVREAVSAFRADFKAARDQIGIVNPYKKLHDLFQEVEVRHNLIDEDRWRLPTDPSAWERIALHEPDLRTALDDLLYTAQRFPANHNQRWVSKLELLRASLLQSVDNMEQLRFNTACDELHRILNREPSRINTWLVAAAGALRLADLVVAITAIRDNLVQSDTLGQSDTDRTFIEQITISIAALTILNDTLHTQVAHHQAWQDIDDELRRVGAISQDINEIELAWPDVMRLAMGVYGNSSADWAITLSTIGSALETALMSRMTSKVQRSFREYRSSASRRFRQVDDALLSLCNDLQKIGDELNLLLRMIG